jgi:hypothetical protein
MSDDGDKELYERFGDIIHEIPEIIDPLREWRDRQARAAVRRTLARERAEKYNAALAWFAERRRQVDQPD